MPTIIKMNNTSATTPCNKVANHELDIINIEDKDDTGPARKKGMNDHVLEEPHMNDSNSDDNKAPAKKKSKNGYAVDIMMSKASSSIGTTQLQGSLSSLSSLSSSSPSCAAEKLHFVNVTKNAPAWKHFKMYNLCFHPDKENSVHCICCGVNIMVAGGNTSSMNKGKM